MKKLMLCLMIGILLSLSLVSASYDYTLNWYDEITGNPVNNVRALNYECLDATCSNLNLISDETSGTNSIAVSYPIPSPTYGYATFWFASDYQAQQMAWKPLTNNAYEDNADFFQYEGCIAEIYDIDLEDGNEGESIDVEIEVISPMDAPSSVPYGQPNDATLIQDYFSSETEVTINILDGGSNVVYTETQTVYIEEDTIPTLDFTWTPDYTQSGTYTVEASTDVIDSKCSSSVQDTMDSGADSFSVADVNSAPVLNALTNRNVDEGSSIQFTIIATDADNDALTYSLVGGVGNLNGNVYSYDAPWDTNHDNEVYTLTFQVSDGTDSDTETISLTINDVNRAPVLDAIGDQNVDEEELLEFTISATDADNDVLIYSAQNLPVGVSFNAGTRTFSWTPNLGDEGTYEVTFRVQDGYGGDYTESIHVYVGDVNMAPVLDAIADVTADEGDIVQFDVSATEPEGEAISYSIQTGVGSLVGQTYTYDTGLDTNHDDENYDVTICAEDPNSNSDCESFTITITDVNRAPVLDVIGDQNVDEEELLEFTISATDADNDVLVYSAQNLPVGASFDAGTRTFSWTPSEVQAGQYSVTFRVDDSYGGFDEETITIDADDQDGDDDDDDEDNDDESVRRIRSTKPLEDSGAGVSGINPIIPLTETSAQKGMSNILLMVSLALGILILLLIIGIVYVYNKVRL